MKASTTVLLSCLVLSASAGAGPPEAAGDRIAPIPASELERLLKEIKPEDGESRWREVPWVTSLTEARRRSVAEDKPLVIFTAADGSPLGRT